MLTAMGEDSILRWSGPVKSCTGLHSEAFPKQGNGTDHAGPGGGGWWDAIFCCTMLTRMSVYCCIMATIRGSLLSAPDCEGWGGAAAGGMSPCAGVALGAVRGVRA
ncbi:hypothetical protein E2C01_030887 [Portunus trituberculatus]|uniref:Uncharacterized protein n=1 Tax=Portunus trituberculatus TaxID=210409 RepID=A0A5B7ERL8_PORTR|nr:hypothetical protein [Portunus trituberculatus]